MKRLVLPLFVALAVSTSLPAQQVSFSDSGSTTDVLLAPPTAGAREVSLVPALNLTFPQPPAAFSVPSAALPDAPAAGGAPQAGYGGDVGYRWHLNAGYEYVHFSSAPFSANMSGLHTTISYSWYEWLAIEGDIISAFGGDVFAPGETSKYVLLTGGGHISWNREPSRWSPWLHVLAGLARVNPQTAYNSKNGFALQAGGGVDYFVNPRLSFRGQADYVLTRLYAETQNNWQAGVGFVLHF